jgi:hypothetical protein
MALRLYDSHVWLFFANYLSSGFFRRIDPLVHDLVLVLLVPLPLLLQHQAPLARSLLYLSHGL